MRRVLPTCLFALTLLSACGGSSDVPFKEDTALQDRLRSAARGYDRTSGLAKTSVDRMPTTGSASFAGAAAMGVYRGRPVGDPDYLVVGDAALTADFARGRLTGTVDNMAGVAPLGGTGFRVPVSGTVRIGGNRSAIGDDPRTNATEDANQFSADFAATMTVDGEPLRANGPVTGGFVGNRVRTSALPATKGLVGAGAGAGTLDGKPAIIGLEFYADVK